MRIRFRPDARAPAPLERPAHGFPRQERQRDVQQQEQAPDHPGHLERAAVLHRGRRVVRLDVERREDAQDDADDAAHEDGEEVVDAGAVAPQAVQALEVVRHRDQQADEGQDAQRLLERRQALRDRNQIDAKADEIGAEERHHREDGVRDDVVGDQRPLVASDHSERRPRRTRESRRTTPCNYSRDARVTASLRAAGRRRRVRPLPARAAWTGQRVLYEGEQRSANRARENRSA